MKFILTDIMKLAKRRKYIIDNPFNDVEINTNSCRPIGKQTDTSRVYLPDEKEKLFQAANHELTDFPELCNKADIDVKSAHDIRRTVASELFNNGVPVEIIRNYLGHSDIKTTWGYILDKEKDPEIA